MTADQPADSGSVAGTCIHGVGPDRDCVRCGEGQPPADPVAIHAVTFVWAGRDEPPESSAWQCACGRTFAIDGVDEYAEHIERDRAGLAPAPQPEPLRAALERETSDLPETVSAMLDSAMSEGDAV